MTPQPVTIYRSSTTSDILKQIPNAREKGKPHWLENFLTHRTQYDTYCRIENAYPLQGLVSLLTTEVYLCKFVRINYPCH